MGKKKRGKGNRVGEASGAASAAERGTESRAVAERAIAPKPVAERAIAPRPADERPTAPRPVPARGLAAVPAPVSGSGSSSGVKVDYSKIEFMLRVQKGGCMHNNVGYHRNEFLRVYLENDEFVAKPLCESRLNTVALGLCYMHRCGSRIYQISWMPMMDVNSVPKSLPVQGETIDCHTGISWFDLNDKTSPKKWHSGPPLEMYKASIEAAVFGKQIYFLLSEMALRPKVYDTDADIIKDYQHALPEQFSELDVDPKIIPQPRKDRILVHLSDPVSRSSELYAWKPNTNNWHPITTDIDAGTWKFGSPMLVNGVLYFYNNRAPSYFSAFDLGSKKWLKVKWSTPFFADAIHRNTDTLFHLNNRLICLPSSRDIYNDDKYTNPMAPPVVARVYVTLFHFYRTTTPDDEPVVIFTHLFTKTLDVKPFVRIVGVHSLS